MPDVFFFRSMVALLVAVPDVSGASMTQELYSPHLDVHQRLLILETLAEAAQQMADPRLRLAAQERQTDTRQDRLMPSKADGGGVKLQEGDITETPVLYCHYSNHYCSRK